MSYAVNNKNMRMGVIFIVVLVSMLLLEFVGFGKIVQDAGSWVFRPVQIFSTKTVHLLSQPYVTAQHVHKASRRIQDLELKYAQSSAALGELDALRLENQALIELLENSDRTLDDTVIITSPILSYAQPAISAGSDDGVREGSLVLSANTLLGVVKDTTEKQARVALLSQQNTQPILATTERGVQGLVVGDGRRVLLTEVPINEEIELNERVVTVGQKGVRRGVFIGRVISIQSEHSSSAKVVILEPLVSFYESVIVEVE